MVQTHARTKKLVKRKRLKKYNITEKMLEGYFREIFYKDSQEKQTLKLYTSSTGLKIFQEALQRELDKHGKSSFIYGNPHAARGSSVQHMFIPE